MAGGFDVIVNKEGDAFVYTPFQAYFTGSFCSLIYLGTYCFGSSNGIFLQKNKSTMKILKIVLLIVGVVLIIFGLYNAFVPQEVLDIGPLEVNAKEGMTNQTLGMIGIGVLALIAGALIKNRR